jgi:hypothetical protein
MRIMAEERGLRRRYVIPVPVLTPRLSSLWIHLVTPISHRIARPLATRNRRLALRAEMKLPGEALLEFTLEPEGSGTRLMQTARFLPRGLAGLAYWYAVLPLHAVVFRGMLQGVRRAAADFAHVSPVPPRLA